VKVSVGVFPTTPVAEIVELAGLLDHSACDTMWIGDSHLIWRECWTTIGACAGATKRLRFGPCVTNPLSRHPTVTASTVATLQELSGGRIRLGISVGDSALRMTLGRVATLAELRAGYALVRSLLEDGVAVSGDRSLEVALTAPGTEIYLSGSGPRTMSLAAELGDGVIMIPGVVPERVVQADAALAAGESLRPADAAPPRRMLWVGCSIREDPADALDDVRPFVASVLRHPLAFEVSEEVEQIRTRIQAQYEFGHHMARSAGHADAVPDHVVREFVLAGTSDDVASGLARLRDRVAPPVDEVALVLMAPDRMDTAARLRDILR
jgi:alkanesulfonate monooxygenase SsuD/methylene tetrahydromethanopterin reductase-like flavin-dependent oxidoreductase (luciferase family)